MRGGRGSRGGGSRSRSHRSSYRRRHRHHRYYGYTPYGYRSYGTTEVGRRGGFVILFIFLSFFYLFGSLFAFIFIAAPEQRNFYVESGRQKLITLSSNYKSVTVSFEGGIYITDSVPPIIGTHDVEDSESTTVGPDSYVYWVVYLEQNVQMEINWTADAVLKVYILEGRSEFNKWKDGKTPFGSLKATDNSGSIDYTASKSDDVYIAFENDGFPRSTVSLSRTVTIKDPVYSLDGLQKFNNGDTIPVEKEKYLLLVNDKSVDLEASINIEKKLGVEQFKIIWLIVSGILLAFAIFVIYKAGDKKEARATVPPPSTQPMTQPTGGTYVYTSNLQQQPHQQPQQSLQQPSTSNSWVGSNMVRPDPLYCPNCSAPYLKSDKFCGSCGAALPAK